MTDKPVPVEVRKFIEGYIRSVEHLEILCLLVDGREKSWTEDDVFREIQSSKESVNHRLQQFHAEGFLGKEPNGTYRFAPKNKELEAVAVSLVKLYRTRRVSIVECIYEFPVNPIQNFADAFRLRKDK